MVDYSNLAGFTIVVRDDWPASTVPVGHHIAPIHPMLRPVVAWIRRRTTFAPRQFVSIPMLRQVEADPMADTRRGVIYMSPRQHEALRAAVREREAARRSHWSIGMGCMAWPTTRFLDTETN